MTIYNRACDCGKISAKDVSLYYGDFQALRRITLEIPQCAITAIIGPSGCGKSSFLRILNRMNDLINKVRVEGELQLDGTSIYEKTVDVVDLRKRVGMVFQKPNPFPMSVFDNIAFGPRQHGRRNRTELERIGDHAEGIAKIVIMIGDEPPLKPIIDLPRMAEKTADMLHRSLDAFYSQDSGLARKIAHEDDEVDALYDQVYRELLSFMAEDPKTITRATRLIWVAHNLERSADRVTNICERVVFTVTGKMEEIGASNY
jgi:ABC-type phosphate transport system ATPase subunit